MFFRPKKSKKSKKSKTKEKPDEDFEDGFDKMERERREDLEERDAFAQRVIKRDKEKQRNAAEKVKKQHYKAKLLQLELIHIFARAILLMKKLEIEKN